MNASQPLYLFPVNVLFTAQIETDRYSQWRNDLVRAGVGRFSSAEFSLIPNQTQLNTLINVFKITKATGRCIFFSLLELIFAGLWLSRTKLAYTPGSKR